MRWAHLATAVLVLAGCLDFSVAPGELRCDPAVDPPCPKGWLCLLEASADRYGRCYPDESPIDDPRLAGPRAAPAVTVPGRRFFVDPATGSPENPGTEQAPWRTLAEVVTSGKIERHAADGSVAAAGVVHGGDALVLRDGDHGDVDLTDYFNPQKIYVLAAEGAHPRLAGLSIHNGRNWWIQGLTLQASGCGAGEGMISIDSASAIELVGNTLRSTEDRADWSASDWKSQACNGISLSGAKDVRVAFNELRNVNDGIRGNSSKITLERNFIDGFCGKAMAVAGSNIRDVRILGNLATNAYSVGFSQTLVHGSMCDGCGDFEIRGNRLLAHRDPQLPAAFRDSVQGIGLFNGPYDTIEIVNNLVIGGHWHGISVDQGADVSIVNNTAVIAEAVADPEWTRIQVTGTEPSVTVRNNLTNRIDVPAGATADHNGVVDDPAAYFVDWQAGDYRPSADSPAVDSGSTVGAPADDLFGQPRDARPDQGALERAP